MDIKSILDNFKGITEQYEVRRTLDVVIRDESYRVEILYCYSNPNARWTAEVYRRGEQGWDFFEDFPWVADRDEEAAIRSALNFLQERAGN